MATAFLIFLALAWIVFVLPRAERARRETPLPQTIRFQRARERFARLATNPTGRPRGRLSETGRWVLVPHSEQRTLKRARFRQAQRRRRKVFSLLLLCSGFSLIPAAILGHGWVELHLLADAVVLFYVAGLLEMKRRREERSLKVTPLRPVRGRPTSERMAMGEN